MGAKVGKENVEKAGGTGANEAWLPRESFAPANAYLAPATETERRLLGLWAQVLRIDGLGVGDNFFEFGGDSFAATALFVEIEQSFGDAPPPETILDHPTVASLGAFLAGEARLYSAGSLVPMQAEGADPPLFLIHTLDGQLMGYRHLLRRLGARRKVYGLRYPGRDRISDRVLSIPEMAATYVEVVREVQACGPYFLVGWSLGGSIAYEMASQLDARGDEIGLLVLIDAPTADGSVCGLQQIARKLARHLFLMSDEKPRRWMGYLFGVLGSEFQRSWTGLSQHRPKDRPQALGDLLHAQERSYRPSAYKGPIKLLRCNLGLSYWHQRNLGWDKYAGGPIETFDMPADHMSVMAEPMVALVAAYLDQWLKEAEET